MPPISKGEQRIKIGPNYSWRSKISVQKPKIFGKILGFFPSELQLGLRPKTQNFWKNFDSFFSQKLPAFFPQKIFFASKRFFSSELQLAFSAKNGFVKHSKGNPFLADNASCNLQKIIFWRTKTFLADKSCFGGQIIFWRTNHVLADLRTNHVLADLRTNHLRRVFSAEKVYFSMKIFPKFFSKILAANQWF